MNYYEKLQSMSRTLMRILIQELTTESSVLKQVNSYEKLQSMSLCLASIVAKIKSYITVFFKGTNETIRNNIHDIGFKLLKLM